MSLLIIKKQKKEMLSLDKKSLVDVVKTNDGLIFNLIEKIAISYYDPYMPDSTKELIANTCNKFSGNLDYEIELSDYRTPIIGRVVS